MKALHQIHITRDLSPEEAYALAEQHINKPKAPTVTNKLYKITHLKKKHFVAGSMNKEKVSKGHHLVIGDLKPEYAHLDGSGLKDKIKNVASAVSSKVKKIFTPLTDKYNNASQRMIAKYGDKEISSMQIRRTPIAKVLDQVLNLISLGKWNKAKKEQEVDELFHLALIVVIDGKQVVIEKNAAIDLSTNFKTTADTQVLPVPMGDKKFTLNDMLEKTRKTVGDQRYFAYDPFTNNCQYFIRYLLQSVGLYTDAAKNFLFQDLTKIIEKLPTYVNKVATAVTTTGAVVEKFLGKGEKGGG